MKNVSQLPQKRTDFHTCFSPDNNSIILFNKTPSFKSSKRSSTFPGGSSY